MILSALRQKLTASLFAVFLLGVCTLGEVSAQERVRAGYSGISGYQVPLWLAADLGLFRKYGLNVEPILFRGGAESSLALTSGEIQFDVVAPQPHIAADLAGADILIIGTYFNKHTYSIVARAGLRLPQELRGKKIGVLSVIGLNQIVVATALRHWGIDEKSVTLVRAGGSRDRLTALQSGLIDATVLTGAFVDRAKAAGLSVLLDLGDLEDSFPTVSLLTTKGFQTAKRNQVRSFLQGISEAIHIFRADPGLVRKVCRNGCAPKIRLFSKAPIEVMRRACRFRPIPCSPEFKWHLTI